jgi:hypothetical protein
MATVVYKNAVLLVDGAELQGSLTELSIEFGAEILDDTHFGVGTRVHRGGLYNAKITAKGHVELGFGNIEQVLFTRVGTDDVPVAVFANGVTEGGTATGTGYAMKGTIIEFTMGEQVGGLLGLNLTVEGRGIV